VSSNDTVTGPPAGLGGAGGVAPRTTADMAPALVSCGGVSLWRKHVHIGSPPLLVSAPPLLLLATGSRLNPAQVVFAQLCCHGDHHQCRERCEQVGLDIQRDTQARLGFANEVRTRSILHGALTH